jgi:hypothetical protein
MDKSESAHSLFQKNPKIQQFLPHVDDCSKARPHYS